MELTYESIIQVVKEINERYPDRGAGKHEVALYFDTDADKLKRLRIEEEYKLAYDDTMANYDNWLKRLNFKNSAEYKLDTMMPELDSMGDVKSVNTKNEYGQIRGRQYFHKDYVPKEYLTDDE